MSTLKALRERFKKQREHFGHSRANDDDLAALARCTLSEAAGENDLVALRTTIASRKADHLLKEAVVLLSCYPQKNVYAAPKTLRVIVETLLYAWAYTDNAALEKRAAEALIRFTGDKEETDQFQAALRECAKRDTPSLSKLLRLLAHASARGGNEGVVRWAFRAIGRETRVESLFFAAACLVACGHADPAKLTEAATYHIAQAARKFAEVKEHLYFPQSGGGAHKPMDETLRLVSATLVEVSWTTSNMGGTAKSKKEAERWLDFAAAETLKCVGTRKMREYGIELAVYIYPYVENWFARRAALKPVATVSRMV